MSSGASWPTQGIHTPLTSGIHCRAQAALCLSFWGFSYSVWKVGLWSEQHLPHGVGIKRTCLATCTKQEQAMVLPPPD